MSQFNDTGYKAFTCGGAIGQFLRVKLVAGVLQIAGLADRGLGTLRAAAFASGDVRAVSLRSKQGTAQYMASGAINAGADVFTDANGMITATQQPGSFHVGSALEAASASGDVIEVLHTTTGTSVPAASLTFTPAAGAGGSNISNVTVQVVDSNGNAVAGVFNLDLWLSDAATGAGLTATLASGTVVAGAAGTDLGDFTAKKAKHVQTNAAGQYVLAITDTAKTHFYPCGQVPGRGTTVVGTQLTTANYG